MKVIINCPWAASKRVEFEEHIFTVNEGIKSPDYIVDFYPLLFSEAAEKEPPFKRVVAFGEPSVYFDYSDGFGDEIASFYKGGILSWHKQLKNYSQYMHYIFGTSWMIGFPIFHPKKFGISGIFSPKSDPRLEGYAIRRKIISEEDNYSIPTMVYNNNGMWKGSKFQFPQEDKSLSFNYMFHWAIESCQEEDYFTEKLLDCFLMETVPIYFGDPNISSRFDSRGIIIFDKDNIVKQANKLTSYDYESRIEYIKENKKTALKYTDNLKNVLLCLLRRFP